MPRKIPVLAFLILIVVVGTFFRTYGLERVVVWHDEAMTLMHCSGNPFAAKLVQASFRAPVTWQLVLDEYQNRRCPLSEVSSALRTSHPEHAPGFYEAFWFWRMIFDEKDARLMRLFPVIFGILTLPAFYWFAFELFRKSGPALLAVSMLTISPLQIVYSQELREYSLYTFLFSLSCAAFLRAWRTNRFRDWFVHCGLTIASVYTTFLMLIVVGAHVLYATGDTLLEKLRSRRGHFRFQSIRWSVHTISVGLALLVVSPILLSLIRNYGTAMEMLKWLQQHMTPLLRLRFWSFSPLFNWAFYPTFQFPLPGGMDDWLLQLTTVLVVQLVSWVYLFRREKRVAAYLLLLCLGFAAAFWLPDLLDGGRRATVVRYFLPLTMIMTLPMGYFLYHLWQSNGAKRFFAACLAAFLFGCQIQSDLVVAECPERARWECDIKPIAACLAKDPDALIITDHKSVSLAQVIAIGRVLDEPNRKFAWLYFAELPDWMKKVDHAFVLHARWHVVNRFRRNGFEVRWVDRERGLLWVRPLVKPANGPS